MEKERPFGFTLIELLVTVAILTILAAVAYPTYISYLARGHRTDAKTVLLDDAQFLERNFTLSNKYNKDSAGANISLPYTQAPKSGTAVYTVSATTLTATTFTLTAVPVAGGPMASDDCGSFTYDQQGIQGVSGGLGVDTCWNK